MYRSLVCISDLTEAIDVVTSWTDSIAFKAGQFVHKDDWQTSTYKGSPLKRETSVLHETLHLMLVCSKYRRNKSMLPSDLSCLYLHHLGLVNAFRVLGQLCRLPLSLSHCRTFGSEPAYCLAVAKSLPASFATTRRDL